MCLCMTVRRRQAAEALGNNNKSTTNRRCRRFNSKPAEATTTISTVDECAQSRMCWLAQPNGSPLIFHRLHRLRILPQTWQCAWDHTYAQRALSLCALAFKYTALNALHWLEWVCSASFSSLLRPTIPRSSASLSTMQGNARWRIALKWSSWNLLTTNRFFIQRNCIRKPIFSERISHTTA